MSNNSLLIWACIWKTYKSSANQEYHQLCRLAHEHAKEEDRAAIFVQSTWRGYRQRKFLTTMESVALLIQRVFRGFLARKRMNDMLDQEDYNARMIHYNSAATNIQKIWRGYSSRKVKFDFYKRQRFLTGLVFKMKDMNALLEAKRQDMRRRQAIVKEERRIEMLDRVAGANHHLAGTKALKGVLSAATAERNELGLDERALWNSSAMRKIREGLAENVVNGGVKRKVPLIRTIPEREMNKLAQGPFLPQYEVNRLKLRPLKPTLRVETDYFDSLENERERVRRSISLRLQQGVPSRSKTKGVWRKPEIFLAKEPYSPPFNGQFRSTRNLALPRGIFKVAISPIKTFDLDLETAV